MDVMTGAPVTDTQVIKIADRLRSDGRPATLLLGMEATVMLLRGWPPEAWQPC
ncbi:hypothetical protein [Nonomuraea sp. bgisy101]|uniref:hypothetical protein n=1 Tax=Nonomuraea sp. bgisy101 TaxID=3413784 RepID=UPI003D73F58C